MEKSDFINRLEELGVAMKGKYLVFYKDGKYGKPEAWLYEKRGIGMGLLITQETLEDEIYAKEYLADFIN